MHLLLHFPPAALLCCPPLPPQSTCVRPPAACVASSAPPPVAPAPWGGGWGAQPRQLQTSWMGMQMMVSASISASTICGQGRVGGAGWGVG